MSVETYRTTVAPADCDHLGHMNVQHYFRAVSEGMFSLMAQVGLGPAEIRVRKLSFAVVHADTDFWAELHAGDIVALRTGIEAVGRKSAEFRHELINVASGQTAMTTRFKCVLLDLDRRVAVEVPRDIRDRLTARASPPTT
ncbi:MAG: acyl-CoA thioesterase [Acidimicrobiia bacterium]